MRNFVLLTLVAALWFFQSCGSTGEGNEQSEATATTTTASEPLGHNNLTKAEREAGWELLFDGETTTGWRNYKEDTISHAWQVVDGTLFLNTDIGKGGDIISTEQYENFDLYMDWKIDTCGNSGLFFHVVENEKYSRTYHSAPEMQILDNCHKDGKIKTHRAGDLYDLIESSSEPVRPGGEWNTFRVVCQDGHVEQWVNGVKVVEYTMFTDEWSEMIANSKFKDMEGWGLARTGHLALQDHQNKVWFRNMKIKKL